MQNILMNYDPKIYLCENRPLTPTVVGYNAAAFYRYRAIYGAEVDNKIEQYPSDQWGLY